MTKRRQLQEQTALHSYRRQASGNANRPYTVRGSERNDAARYGEVRTLPRTVSVPDSNFMAAWDTFSLRQEQMRRARARPKRYVKAVPRTYAQTGSYAPAGRARGLRRPLPYSSSPIPRRSGRTAMRRGFFWKLLSLFALVAVLAVGMHFAFTSNAFRIEQVTVVGTHNDALVRSIQQMGMQGQNIFLVNVESLAARIEETPTVASATLSRQWPNQLVVTIVERTPALLWQTAQGTYSIDSSGVVIAAAKDTPGANQYFTVIDVSKQGQNSAVLRPGMHLNRADIMYAAEMSNQLPKVLGTANFKLQYDGTLYANMGHNGKNAGRGSFIVQSTNGWLAYLGNADDSNPLENKLLELQTILNWAQKKQLNVATIDLRYGLNPVYTLKS